MKKLLALLLITFSCEAQSTLNLGLHIIDVEVETPIDTGSAEFTSFAEFMTYAPPSRFEGWNPVITHDATYTNICPGGTLINPSDTSEFILYVGEHPGNTRTNARVSAYTAPKNDPINFTRVGVVLSQGVSGPDKNGVGFGSIVEGPNGGDSLYYYYVGVDNSQAVFKQTVCLAKTIDGINFTKYGKVLQGNGTTEYNLTDPTVRSWGGTLHMYVTGKSSSGLPTEGLVHFTSTNGTTWTRQGQVIARGGSTTIDAKYIEGGDAFQIGSDYVIPYSTSSNSNVWSIAIASSTSPNGPFTKWPVAWIQHYFFTNSVAVPILFNTKGKNWYVFFQSTDSFQPADTWDVHAVKLIFPPEQFPIGFLPGWGTWSGNHFFDTSGDPDMDSYDRVIRALDNTGSPNAQIDNTDLSITPAGSGAWFSSIIRSTNTSAGTLVNGFYLMEGGNQVAGIYLGDGQIKYLDNTGWNNLQAASNNTNYEVRINVISSTQYTIQINGGAASSPITNATSISSTINRLRLQKGTPLTTMGFYADLKYTTGGVTTSINYGQQ